jgi:hypothetical protein
LNKIRQVGRPQIADAKWLSSIGFSSPKATTLLGILKAIGLTDNSGRPTERWLAYRDNLNGKKALAVGVHEAYADLFSTYSDACNRSENELKSFFESRTSAGPDPIAKMVLTFRTLCAQSDFGETQAQQGSDNGSAALVSGDTESGQGAPFQIARGTSAGVTVNINIQLALPETTDETVYDNFFSAMKKHLLS